MGSLADFQFLEDLSVQQVALLGESCIKYSDLWKLPGPPDLLDLLPPSIKRLAIWKGEEETYKEIRKVFPSMAAQILVSKPWNCRCLSKTQTKVSTCRDWCRTWKMLGLDSYGMTLDGMEYQ